MESKLVTLFIIPTLSITILIQTTVAREPSTEEEIGGVSKTEVRKFLNQQENLQQILEIFTIAKNNVVTGTKDAQKKIASYGKKKLPKDLKRVLDHIASVPEAAFKEMEPMFKEIQELNNELETESVAYRMVTRPLISVARNLKNLGMRIFGYSVRTVGDVMALFVTSAQKGSDAYYEGKPAEESEKTNQVFQKIHSGIDKVRDFSDKVEEKSKRGLQKVQLEPRRTRQAKAEKSRAEAETEHDGEPNRPKESLNTADV